MERREEEGGESDLLIAYRALYALCEVEAEDGALARERVMDEIRNVVSRIRSAEHEADGSTSGM